MPRKKKGEELPKGYAFTGGTEVPEPEYRVDLRVEKTLEEAKKRARYVHELDGEARVVFNMQTGKKHLVLNHEEHTDQTDPSYQVMPDLTPEEFEALKADIAEKGVTYPVIMDPFGNILDGHHRARAWDELVAEEAPITKERDLPVEEISVATVEEARNHAWRLNSLRRSMGAVAKRQMVQAKLMESPEYSDRRIAGLLGVSHHTVGNHRHDLEQSGQLPGFEPTMGGRGKTVRTEAKEVVETEDVDLVDEPAHVGLPEWERKTQETVHRYLDESEAEAEADEEASTESVETEEDVENDVNEYVDEWLADKRAEGGRSVVAPDDEDAFEEEPSKEPVDIVGREEPAEIEDPAPAEGEIVHRKVDGEITHTKHYQPSEATEPEPDATVNEHTVALRRAVGVIKEEWDRLYKEHWAGRVPATFFADIADDELEAASRKLGTAVWHAQTIARWCDQTLEERREAAQGQTKAFEEGLSDE